MDKLKPCPFCGNNCPKIFCNQVYETYYIYCDNCGVKTPEVSTKDKAIEHWNRRTNNATD